MLASIKGEFMVTVGVIGFGYWGPNLVRNFSHANDCRLKLIVDNNPARLEVCRKMYPHVDTTNRLQDLWDDNEIDAVIIATPICTHYELAKQALENNKHVLVEKPLTNSRSQAIEILETARKRNKILMVDHIYLYNGAVQKIKEMEI